MKIAICITTRNRPEAFNKTYANWEKHLPDEAKIFVVDDCSGCVYVDADYRFSERSGIPKVKNKCLELAFDWGADHIFLSDDDCYPISDNWHKPYIESGVNHLCYTFTSGWNGTPAWRQGQIKDNLVYHVLGCGCIMYFTRKCLEVVGGFDDSFGLGKYEHTNMSRRIFNAGLTDAPFIDVVDSDKLFHSMDQHGEIERSFTDKEQKELLKINAKHSLSKMNSKEYIDFKNNGSQ